MTINYCNDILKYVALKISYAPIVQIYLKGGLLMDNDFEKDKNGLPEDTQYINEENSDNANGQISDEGYVPSDTADEEAYENPDNEACNDCDCADKLSNEEAEDEFVDSDESKEEKNSDLAENAEQEENIQDSEKVSYELRDIEETEKKQNIFKRLIEREKEKERNKIELFEQREENMKKIREQQRARLYADGKEPNALQKFLMSEGKYINYENKYLIVLIFSIILAVIVFILTFKFGFITKEKFGLGGETTRAIVYSKGNELYCYDLKGEPVLISDNLSSGGSATYSYVGNGITVAEDGKSVYFIDNVAADGTFSFSYYMAGKNSEPDHISDNVADYGISYEGDGAVYVVPDETGRTGTLYGYSRKDNKSYEIAQNIAIGGTDYDISADGRNVIYVTEENNSLALNISSINGDNSEIVDTDVAQYLVTTKGDNLYYIKAVANDDGTSSYTLYNYDMKKDSAELIDENVIAVTLSGEENALIYYKNNGNMIKALDIVNDDGDDSEAVKALRAEIADYEFKDIASSVYRYENGEKTLVNDTVFTAVPMDDEGKYIAYTVPQKLDEIRVNLSEITNVNEISALYYMQAMQADCDTYIYEFEGFNDYVVFENPYIYSFSSSGNNAQVACLTNYDENTNSGQLILSTLSSNGIVSYSELENDVESYQFLGDGARIVYLRDIQPDGSGTLTYIESNVPDEISDSAYYYEAATDYYRRVFYLDNYDSSTYGGTFHIYQQADDTVIDDNVYMFAYRNNNNALYMKDYDVTTGTGDLYYLDGKNSVLVDEDVSSIFDFYRFS